MTYSASTLKSGKNRLVCLQRFLYDNKRSNTLPLWSDSLLAVRAKPCGAAAKRCRFQLAAATWTFAAFAATRQQPRSWHQIHIRVGIDCLFQNVTRGAEKPRNCFLVQSRRLHCRVNACAEKNFIGVNVSDACDQLLVEQHRFHRTAMRSQDVSELRTADVQRVRAKYALFQKFIHIFDQPNLAELALILECEAMRIGENKEHAHMVWRFPPAFAIPKRTGHAEVQSEPELSICAHKQMFAVPPAAFEATPFQSTRQLRRSNALQNICVSHVDADDPLMQRCCVEVSLEIFDLG